MEMNRDDYYKDYAKNSLYIREKSPSFSLGKEAKTGAA